MKMFDWHEVGAIAGIAAVALAVPVTGALARPANILELDRGTYGFGHLSDTTSFGGSNIAALLLSEGNTIAQTSDLSGSLSGYDAVWVSNNAGSALTASEISNLAAFVSAGGKLVLIGDQAHDGKNVVWDKGLAAVVGAKIADTFGTAIFANPIVTDTLTDGLASGSPNGVRFKSYSTIDPLAGSPDFLFDVAAAGMFDVGAGEALMILDTDWLSNTSAGIPARQGNAAFAHNISVWLDPPGDPVPEPETLVVMGFGLLALAGLQRWRG